MRKLDYRGYEIVSEKNHYRVISPSKEEWTEDTIEDAKDAIDEELMNS